MPDTTLVLGDFQFASFEVPEQIGFGGEQQLVVHELVGGLHVIDAMGERPTAVEWSGIFAGASALDRALALDAMRKAGKPLELTWSELSYQVVIRSVRCTFQRFYRLPYSIVCEVISDQTAPVLGNTDPSNEQLIGDDLSDANDSADGLGDGLLSGGMATLTGAISAIGPLSQAAPSALGALGVPLIAARSRAKTLLSATTGTLSSGSIGGVAPGVPAAQQAASLLTAVAAASEAPRLIQIDRTLGRMEANIASLGSGSMSVTQAGGDLFTVAANEYGDARGWSAIAAANNLTDPKLSGITTLAIPPLPAGADGILNV